MKQEPRKKSIFSADTAVQTENIVMGTTIQPTFAESDDVVIQEDRSSDATNQLTSSDLSAILKWSSDVSSDMNLFSGRSSTTRSFIDLC